MLGNEMKYVVLDNGEEKLYARVVDIANDYDICPSTVCKMLKGGNTILGRKRGVVVFTIADYDDLVPVREHRIYTKKGYARGGVHMLDRYTHEILDTFETVVEAYRELGVARSSAIAKVCRGEIQTAYGYKWEYVDKEIPPKPLKYTLNIGGETCEYKTIIEIAKRLGVSRHVADAIFHKRHIRTKKYEHISISLNY